MIREYLAAGDAGSESRLRRVVHAGIVTHSPGDVVLVGVEDLMASWATARRGLAELKHDIVAELHSGDLAAARVRVSGIHRGPFLGAPATGNRIEVDQALFARIVAGRIVELWEVVDTGSGLRQLGLLPTTQPLEPGPQPS